MTSPAGVEESHVPSVTVSSPKLRAKSTSPDPEPELKSSESLEQKIESKSEIKVLSLEPDDTETRGLTPAPIETVSIKSILDRKDIIDMEVLGQILELDEPENHEFSIGMAWAYFDQAKSTFNTMDTELDAEDLPALSSLGHFLKGSSAALGIMKVRESCERIQHYGNLRDEETNQELSKDQALERIKKSLVQVRGEYKEAEQWLRKYYEVNAPNETPPDGLTLEH